MFLKNIQKILMALAINGAIMAQIEGTDFSWDSVDLTQRPVLSNQAIQDIQQNIEAGENRLLEQKSSLKSLAITLNNLCFDYSYIGENERAILYGTQALKCVEAIGEPGLWGMVFGNLAIAYLSLGLYNDSLHYLKRLLSVETLRGKNLRVVFKVFRKVVDRRNLAKKPIDYFL